MERKDIVVFPALASLLAAGMAAVYVALRQPFDINLLLVAKVLLLGLILINAPAGLFFVLRKYVKIEFFQFNSIVVIGALVLIVLAGLVNFHALAYPLFFVGLISTVYILVVYFRNLRREHLWHWVWVAVIVLWVSGVVWEGRYLSPIMLEKIISGFYNSPDANCGLDTLYHMSVSQMIKNYHVTTTGLNGLPYIPYYYGSHYLFAQVSLLLDVPIMDMYPAGVPIIFVPFFFYVVFVVAHQVRSLNEGVKNFDFSFWVIVLIVFIGILPRHPESIAFRTSLAHNTIFGSESYMLSLMFLFIGISLIVVPVLKSGSWSVKPSTMLASLVLIGLIGYTKMSTLFIFDVMLGYLFVRYQAFRSIKSILFMIAAVASSAALLILLNDPKAPNGGIEWMHYYRHFIYSRFLFFIILSFLWTFVCLAMWIFLVRRKVSFNPFFFELQMVIAVVGFLPAAFLRIEGGSAFYFTDPEHWTALFCIAYYLPLCLSQLDSRKMKWSVIAGTFCMVAITLNSLYSAMRVWKDNYATKNTILGQPNYSLENVTLGELISHRSVLWNRRLRKRLREHPGYRKVEFLRSLEKMSNKSSKILYVLDEGSMSRELTCLKFPFFTVAATGMCLFEGYSVNECYWGNYGVEYYDITRKTPDDNVCERISNPRFRDFVSVNVSEEKVSVTNCK